MKQNILNEAKRIEQDCQSAATSHHAMANRYERLHWYIGIPTMVLAIIAGSMALSPFENLHMIGGIVAIISAGFATAMLFIHPNAQANIHRHVASRYNTLQNNTRLFYEIEGEGLESDVELTSRINELSAMRDELNLMSPAIRFQALKQIVKKHPDLDKDMIDVRETVA